MSSLIPEKPILVSPSLAATIGLEEATMLTVLNELVEHRAAFLQQERGYAWLQLDGETVRRYLPFWTDHDLQRISKSLKDKGVILIASAPFVESQCLRFAFNEEQTSASASSLPTQNRSVQTKTNYSHGPQAHNTPVRGANRIAPNWQPSDDVVQKLRQHSVDDAFIREQIPEFITYWRERDEPAHAWGAKFQRQVLRAWRNHETEFQRKDANSVIANNWRPSEDALEVLVKHASINAQFVEDAIPEFVLYWQERGEASRTWNSKFIQHVRRQWNRYTATVENDTVPKTIPPDWQPSRDVYDILRMANIDANFAKSLVQEFILFWHDSQQVHSSWNTKFLQHVKYHWAKTRGHTLTEANASHERQANHTTRKRSLVDDLTDRSWAF